MPLRVPLLQHLADDEKKQSKKFARACVTPLQAKETTEDRPVPLLSIQCRYDPSNAATIHPVALGSTTPPIIYLENLGFHSNNTMNTVNKQETLLKFYGTTDRREAWRRLDEAEGKMDISKLEEWTTMNIPYYAPESELPRPLPTITEIEGARNTKDDLARRTGGLKPVYRIDGVFVVKICEYPFVLQEAENLLFLQKHSQVRVPKIYAAYCSQGLDPYNYLHSFPRKFPNRNSLPIYHVLIMEYIDGTPLNTYSPGETRFTRKRSWDTYTQRKRDNISKKLDKQLRLLRSVPPPAEPYYGRIYGQPWHPWTHVISRCSIPSTMVGPFKRHEDFVNAIFERSLKMCALQQEEDFLPTERIALERFKEDMSNAHGTNPVLTHFGLKEEDVLLINNPNDLEDPDIVIIDWEFMSWMPAYIDPGYTRWPVDKRLLFTAMDADIRLVADYVGKFLNKTANSY
ncbi:hypothetical protein BU24DRAFT_448658 [Aaosphaeria arxii CBS 175.79]|uniref:Uncharacterized protein n=1 Tax=Aaosphaeria arxii CBS 175.79 TaxID=1450172 RepID=A0A6A5XUH2_9PLEO|nr:uncharacterized protein BU24DRAFT_448658 [Aaosphaeria arxii CBS 175.79]KAF2016852.1 hypothetical protein BU24DRAFT_448658 [Aaosphaeria arxii CBS 175.79]